MEQERKRTERREVAARILATVDELEQLLQGKDVSPAPGGDAREDAFWATNGQLEEALQARSGLLSELVELVLPEVPRTARPIRASIKVSDPARAQALEALAGSVPARARELPWLDMPAISLVGDKLPGDLHQAGPDDSGVLMGREFFLRVDGQLALVESMGTWRIADRKLVVDSVLVRARELTADDLLRELNDFNFMFVLVTLRGLLHGRLPGGEAPRAADLPERQARFDVLIRALGDAMREHVTRLRCVGDSPA